MRIKSADDKTKRLALLQSLLSAPLLDDWQKSQLNNLIVKMRLGIQGEKDAGHYLDNHFIDGKNHAVIHDFRIDVDGEIAQIDHLLINRMLDFYLLETKNFSGNLTISAHGEFSVRYGRDRTVNIPSPIEQSKRHENVLRRLLKRLGIQTRTGRELRFMHVVLVDPKASIERPNPQSFDSRMVIAADQFRTWQQAHLEKIGTLDLLGSAMNLRSSENLLEIAEKVARQHRPENQLHLPDWLAPKPVFPVSNPPIKLAPPNPNPAMQIPAIVSGAKSNSLAMDSGRKKLVCLSCNAKISFEEGKFCWNNDRRFKGGQYCRTHQAGF